MHLTDKCTQHALWSALYDLVDGIEDMRRRKVIDERDDDQFLDAKLAEARRAMKAAGFNAPPESVDPMDDFNYVGSRHHY